MIVIGITGPANSGKSTVTQMMFELTPGAAQIALAGPLKEFCSGFRRFTPGKAK